MTAKFHIGVTSNASKRVAELLAAQVGLAADVVVTPVRSTWAALVAAQSRLKKRLAKPLAAGKATMGIDPSRKRCVDYVELVCVLRGTR